tara:strand:- start:4616 stop:5635 length:1020 start_codon:yes stop_codon:yes gene_type:complete
LKILKNNNFLNALNKNNDALNVPVWLLRQAGRYLPEYREVRAKYPDFFEMIKSPSVCKELTLQPLRRFPLDAAITFTDILTIPEAMGVEIKFIKGQGPVFADSVINNPKLKLNYSNYLEKLDYVFEATELIKSEIEVPLIGFSGSPWTLFVYLFYGRSPRNYELINSYIKSEPENTHAILEVLSNAIKEYIGAQIKSGADCIQIFDSWGGILGDNFNEFSLKYINDISKSLDGDIPLILYAKGNKVSNFLTNTDINCFNLDCDEDIDAYIDMSLTIQGNFDPVDFHKDNSELIDIADLIFEKYHTKPNYIFNVGSGITPDINPDKVSLFLERLRIFNSK